MEWLEEVGIISGIVAILAWVAKARWSDEYSKAKEEVIRAKDTQIMALEREIKALRDLTPMKIHECFNSMETQLTAYIDNQKWSLKKLNPKTMILKPKLVHINLGASRMRLRSLN